MMRAQVLRLQREMLAAQTESATGRKSDLGLEPANAIGRSVDLRSDMSRIETLLSTNALATARLDATQTGLASLRKSLSDLQGIAYGASGSTGRVALADAGRAMLGQAGVLLNMSVAGEPVFSGQNTTATPFRDYLAPGSASKAAVDAAFSATFGFTQDDPAVASITAADLRAFVEGPFADLFNNANWKTNWSSAADERLTSRISPDGVADTSVTANEPAIRKVVAAFVMATDLGVRGLNDNAFTELLSLTREALAESAPDLVALESGVGAMQNRVKSANETMQVALSTLNMSVNDLESVDPYEAATKVTSLMQQLETSYALTARFRQASLLDYL